MAESWLTSRSVWSAPYSGALTFRSASRLQKRRNTAHSKRFATSARTQPAPGHRDQRLHLLSFRIQLPQSSPIHAPAPAKAQLMSRLEILTTSASALVLSTCQKLVRQFPTPEP